MRRSSRFRRCRVGSISTTDPSFEEQGSGRSPGESGPFLWLLQLGFSSAGRCAGAGVQAKQHLGRADQAEVGILDLCLAQIHAHQQQIGIILARGKPCLDHVRPELVEPFAAGLFGQFSVEAGKQIVPLG